MKFKLAVSAVAGLLLATTPAFPQSFVLKTVESGLDLAHHSNGVAVADYDLDGDLDVYLVATGQYDAGDDTTWNRLFQNQGDGTFADVTVEAGVLSTLSGQTNGGMGYKFGAAWGDYDNDGYPDLFLTNLGPDELYHNNGDGTFTNVTENAGVFGRERDTNSSAVWWDYDLDGDLDLYVSAWIGENIMYENLNDGTFLDVSFATGLADTGQTWTSIPLDGDNDGLPDLYVVNDFGANRFYRNRGDKTFVDATTEFGLEDEGHGMGVDLGDYNNDGFFDIYLTNISDIVPCPLFTNNGEGQFVNLARQMGVDDTGWAWGAEFFDCDHDGDLELYVVNGFKIDPGNNYFFDNLLDQGGPLFEDKSAESGSDGEYEARGLVVFDYDNDGDMDLLVANWWQSPYLYENQTVTKNWLEVELHGTVSNRNAFGAMVRVRAGGRTFSRANDGVDFLGQSIMPLHFGLGEAEMADEVTVRWPNGDEETLRNVAVNQLIQLREGQVSGVKEIASGASSVPETFQLHGNFPNPFNGSTTLEFSLPEAGGVTLRIANLLGRQIFLQHEANLSAGRHRLRWHGLDRNGRQVSSGFYLYSLTYRQSVHSGKLLYLK